MFTPDSDPLLSPSVERRVIRVRRHWAALLTVLLQTFWMVVGAFLLSQLVNSVMDNSPWLPALLWYIAVLAVLRLAWKVANWRTEIIIVTNKRFIVTNGVIVNKKFTMPIENLTDIDLARPAIGQLLGYGTLRLKFATQEQKTFKYLPRSREVFVAMSELMYGEKVHSRSHMLIPPRPRRKRWSLARRD